MDVIKYLLGAIVKLAFILALTAFVLWLVGLVYPNFKITNIIRGDVFSRDWLPAPKNYGALLNKNNTTGGMNGKVYQSGPAYNGYANGANTNDQIDWVYYSESGTQVVSGKGTTKTTTSQTQTFKSTQAGFVDRASFLRNMSVFEGGNISYGLTIVGEARDTMFRNGIFPIAIIDSKGNLIASMDAINTGAWSTAGWARFQATVPVRLPAGAACALIFNSANQPVRMGMSVKCN